MSNWDQQQHQQQQHQHHQQQRSYQRSQSVSIPSSQFSSSQYPSSSQQYPADYGQGQYDRRPSAAYPIQPLQVNPSTYLQPDAAHNLPSSSIPQAAPSRGDRHRTQSVMPSLTSIGQRERTYASSSSSGYPRQGYPEATVPISRHSSTQRSWSVQYPNETLPPQVPHISSVMTPYPSRVMPSLAELDRRALPPVDEGQPRPKPHGCDQCGAAFSRAHDLKRHIETHKGDRPHKCPSCTKAFSRKDALQRHQSMAQCGLDQPDTMY